MVRVINIDTKTKTIKISNEDKIDWITVKGTHVPIEKGQSKGDAVNKFVSSKRETQPAKKNTDKEFADYAQKQAYKSLSPDQQKKIDLMRGLKTGKVSPDRFVEEAKKIGKPGDNIQHVSDLLKTPKVKELYDRIGKYAKEHASELPLDHLEHLVALRKILLDDNNAAEHVEKNFQKWFGSSKTETAPAQKKKTAEQSYDDFSRTGNLAQFDKEQNINRKADVSDIVSDYKKQMAALGDKAPLRKTDKVEIAAIQEWVERKVGAGRPYDDYYHYWLSMPDDERKQFGEIYSESFCREKAFEKASQNMKRKNHPEDYKK